MEQHSILASHNGTFAAFGGKPVEFNPHYGIIETSPRRPLLTASPLGKKVKFTNSEHQAQPSADETTKILVQGTPQVTYNKGVERSISHDSFGSGSSEELYLRSTSTTIPPCPRNHDFSESILRLERNKLISICTVSIWFLVLELIGGYFSSSLCIYMLAFHLASQTFGHLVSLVVMTCSDNEISQQIRLGRHRAEIIGALCTSLLLWFVVGSIAYVACSRLLNQDLERDVDYTLMLIISILGFSINLINSLTLLRSSQICFVRQKYQVEHVPRKYRIYFCVCNILVGLPVLATSILIFLQKKYLFLDPIAALVSGYFALLSTGVFVVNLWRVLTNQYSSLVNTSDILGDLLRIPGLKNVHDMHVWPLGFDRTALSMHVTVDQRFHAEPVVQSAQRVLLLDHGIEHSTIQVEAYKIQPQGQGIYAMLS